MKLEIAIAALQEIAQYNDKDGQKFLDHTGSYAAFDQSNAVKLAREAMHQINLEEDKRINGASFKTDR